MATYDDVHTQSFAAYKMKLKRQINNLINNLWDIYTYVIKVAYLSQGEKYNVSSIIQGKVKNVKTKKNGVEIIFNIKL